MTPERPSAQSNRKKRSFSPQSCSPSRSFRAWRLAAVLGVALPLGSSSGCGTVQLRHVTDQDAITVRLDANARAHVPGRQIKFYVDLVNETTKTIDIRRIGIELTASPQARPDTVSLRQSWRYRWDKERLPPLRPMRLPIC